MGDAQPPAAAMEELNGRIVACERCPRLRAYCLEVARAKRRMYASEQYWVKPVPNFGDPEARILLVGLAPAAHGANRTGRMFTGDESGNFLYRAMFETGLASQPESRRGDGLRLTGALITASAHCAPPQNKPTREEFDNCREWLRETLVIAERWRVIVALGKAGFVHAALALQEIGMAGKIPQNRFGHGSETELPDGRWLLGCYHPSQQNTFTGVLTQEMLQDVLRRAKALAGQ